jgi:hypothetical protein
MTTNETNVQGGVWGAGGFVDVPQMHPEVVTHVWCPRRNRYGNHDTVRLTSRSRPTYKELCRPHYINRDVLRLNSSDVLVN